MAGDGKVNWRAVEEEILGKVDILGELRSHVRFSRTQPNESGFVECWAIDRDETNPSCHVYVGIERMRSRGSYGDQAKTQKPLSFWELLVALGRFPDWRAARAHYAEQTGVALPDTTKRQKDGRGRPASVRLISHRFSRHLMNLVAIWRPGITPEAIEAAGYVAAQYTPTETEAYAFPVYHAPNEEPRTYVLLSALAKVFPRSGQYVPERGHHIWGNDDGFVIVGNKVDGKAGPDALKLATTVVWCEGISDTLAAYTHLPAGWVAVTSPKGAAKGTSAAMAELLRGKEIVVIGDADTAGVSGAKIRAGQAVSVGDTIVHMRRPPGEITPSRGRDLRDHFVTGLTWGDLVDIEGAVPREEILVDDEQMRIIEESIECLRKHTDIYVRNGRLCRVIEQEVPGGKISRLEDISPTVVNAYLSNVARLLKPNKKGDPTAVQPPEWLGKAIIQIAKYPKYRVLFGLTQSPFLRLDGSICCSQGYDEASKLFLASDRDWKLNSLGDATSIDETTISEAKESLIDLFSDFPFATDRDLSGIIAALLTVFAKPAINGGTTPLFLIDGNSPGVGKGLLIDIIGQIAINRPVPATTYTPDETEMRKRVVAMGLSTCPPVIKLDEVAGSIGGHVLNSVMTCGSIVDRELGTSRIHEVRVDSVWMATGNNITIRGDFARRVIWIRLESPLESPSQRGGFRYPNILKHVAENREKYVAAILTILRGYFLAGCPQQPLRSFGSYELWSDIVRQCVVWLGLPDPHAPEVVAEIAEDASEERQLIHGLDEVLGGDWGTVSDIIRRVQQSAANEYPAMRDLILSKWGDGKDVQRKLGMFLKKHSEKNIGGVKIVSRLNRQRMMEWRITQYTRNRDESRGKPMQGLQGHAGTREPYYSNQKHNSSIDSTSNDFNFSPRVGEKKSLQVPAVPAVDEPRQENHASSSSLPPLSSPLWTKPPATDTEIAFVSQMGEIPSRIRWGNLPADATGYAIWPFSNGWQSIEHVRRVISASASEGGSP